MVSSTYFAKSDAHEDTQFACVEHSFTFVQLKIRRKTVPAHDGYITLVGQQARFRNRVSTVCQLSSHGKVIHY